MKTGPAFPPSSRAIDLRGPAGRLEALLEEPESEGAVAAHGGVRGAALWCHPHPLHAGTMHNRVVYRAAKASVMAGLSTLRFNFRGVGMSEGRHDEGRGELDDARAALDWLAAHRPNLPLVAGGFSFGAAVGLCAARDDRRVTALVGIGLPLIHASFEFLVGEQRPLLIVQGDKDEFGSVSEVESLVARLGPSARLVVVRDADHFFGPRLAEVGDAVRGFCVERTGS